MNREELIKIVNELEEIIREKKVSPRDALNIADILKTDITEKIKNEKRRYMAEGEFK